VLGDNMSTVVDREILSYKLAVLRLARVSGVTIGTNKHLEL